MLDYIKAHIRKIAIALRIPLSENIQNDTYTIRLLKHYLQPDSCCIDVGAHKGEILAEMIKYAPSGRHIAYEPIPALYDQLQQTYGHTVDIRHIALSDSQGESSFLYLRDLPAYSGLRKRSYPTPIEPETITVMTDTLDHQVSHSVQLIKIDVEGGEYQVLRGGTEIIQRYHPIIVFEFGKGASDYYDTSAADMHTLLSELGYQIYTLADGIDRREPLSLDALSIIYEQNEIYNFIAFAN